MKLAKLAIIILLALVTHAAGAPSGTEPQGIAPAAGLALYAESVDFGAGPAAVHVLRVDLTQRSLKPALANDGINGLETVADTARKQQALAAINGDFWRGGQPPNQGDPANLMVQNGSIVSRPITRSTRGLVVAGLNGKPSVLPGLEAFSLDLRLDNKLVSVPASGQEINSVDKINPSGRQNNIALFTPDYGGNVPVQEGAFLLLVRDVLPTGKLMVNRTYRGRVSVQLPRGKAFTVPPNSVVIAFYGGAENQLPSTAHQPGASVSIAVRLPAVATAWEWAFGGYPTLVHKGVANTFSGWKDGGVINAHPRSSIGIDRAGRFLYLVTVDGRYPGEKPGGAKLAALASYLVNRWNISEALNLDGGGSSTLVVKKGGRYEVVNKPSDGRPRRVAQSILVF